MNIVVEISDETKDKLFLNDMKSNIDDFTKSLKIIKKTKKGLGFFSWDYEEEKKEIKKLLESFEVVYNFYGGN